MTFDQFLASWAVVGLFAWVDLDLERVCGIPPQRWHFKEAK